MICKIFIQSINFYKIIFGYIVKFANSDLFNTIDYMNLNIHNSNFRSEDV